MSNSGFKEGPEENNVDLLDKFVTKSYLMDIYPYLTGMGNIQMAGLWVWGNNTYGQLGDNSVIHKSSPVQTIAGGTNWKHISKGFLKKIAIKTDGTLWTWGYNQFGQLGDNSTLNRSSPIQTICAGSDWKCISSDDTSSYAIKTDGTLWGWGFNTYGQIGDNSVIHKSSPVQTIAGGTNWKYISNGEYHASAIKTDGTLWTWGGNNYGQLGIDSSIFSGKSSPVQTICGGTNWKQVSCGNRHTAAIKTDGTLWVCGYNFYGQLGEGSKINKSSPVQTIAGGTDWKFVDVGPQHSAAIKTDGTLWTWGRNYGGQLMINNIVDKSSPVQTICGGTNWKSVSCGSINTVAIKTDGTLWTCGYNNNGQLCNNTITDKSSPVQTICGGNNWKLTPSENATIREMGDDF